MKIMFWLLSVSSVGSKMQSAEANVKTEFMSVHIFMPEMSIHIFIFFSNLRISDNNAFEHTNIEKKIFTVK